MQKNDYLSALRAALKGLPEPTIESVMADYTRRFDEAILAGRDETEIARELGEPAIIAAALRDQLRDKPGSRSVPLNESMPRAVRVFFTGLGLAVFNAFMVIPATVYAVLLMALSIAGVVCYAGGIALTAGSLSEVGKVSFSLPFEQIVIESKQQSHDTGKPELVRVELGKSGLYVEEVNVSNSPAEQTTTRMSRDGTHSGVREEKNELHSLDTLHGVVIIAIGIVLMLLWAVIVRYTWIGMKHYIRMHLSLLRGA